MGTERCIRSKRSGFPDDRSPISRLRSSARVVSGTLAALHLLERLPSRTLLLCERSPTFGRGAAYATLQSRSPAERACRQHERVSGPADALRGLASTHQRAAARHGSREANPRHPERHLCVAGLVRPLSDRRSCATPSARTAALCACASSQTRSSTWSRRAKATVSRWPVDAGMRWQAPFWRPAIFCRLRAAAELTSPTLGGRRSRRTSIRTGLW